MPLYDLKCDTCGGTKTDEYAPMSVDEFPCGLPTPEGACWGIMHKVPVLPHTDIKEFHKPIEMYSIGCNSPAEIREMQLAGVPISDDPKDELYGVPIATTRKQKLTALKVAGFVETK